MKNAKEMFSDRVEDYRKYRPGYPVELASFVIEKCKPKKDWVIADVGSGTGISTLFLQEHVGCRVYAIEPNKEMRIEAEKAFTAYSDIVSVDGSSGDTTLTVETVNMGTAFQSFHWFNNDKTKKEIKRIIREPGWMLWVWNMRLTDGTKFLEGYESILQELPEYKCINYRNTSIEDLSAFLDNKEIKTMEFSNVQSFDYEGLVGRFFSSSYTAPKGVKEHEEQKVALRKLFEMTNKDGSVEFRYITKAYLGRFR